MYNMGLGEQGRDTKEFLLSFILWKVSEKEATVVLVYTGKDEQAFQTEDFMIALDDKQVARCGGPSL